MSRKVTIYNFRNKKIKKTILAISSFVKPLGSSCSSEVDCRVELPVFSFKTFVSVCFPSSDWREEFIWETFSFFISILVSASFSQLADSNASFELFRLSDLYSSIAFSISSRLVFNSWMEGTGIFWEN